MKDKKEKKAVVRCRICKALLRSAIEIEYGLCVHCLSQIDEKRPAKTATKKPIKNKAPTSPHGIKGTDMSPGIEAAFAGSNTEKLCTRIPIPALDMVEKRIESLNLTPSAYIRDLIETDLQSS